MENIECEERVLLTFAQYHLILKHYVSLYPNHYRYFKNTNIYLDDQNHTVLNSSSMLRIRRIDNKKEELTLKIKQENGDLEINETLENHPTIDKYLSVPFSSLKPITTLKTTRVEIDIDDYMVVIDMNTYNGIIDFDLEIEAKTQERAKEIILSICEKYKIEYKNAYPSKSRRAFASIKK